MPLKKWAPWSSSWATMLSTSCAGLNCAWSGRRTPP
ncbi:Uncharacterised protein [Mycobacteroides abscessus subsp. abscessus]|nr:Uncharacterised protein [Mycobacteroides abscessus subsp. abscessus]